VKRTPHLWLVTGLLALIAVAMIAAPAASAKRCVKAHNIEAIIDDSGSMSFSDPNRLRVQGLDLLISTLPASTYLGAVEFGSGSEFLGIPPANTVFPPEPVGANATAMETALNQAIQADNGATDYNGAFAKADADNPTADARIFLTDGGHNEGVYTEAHLAHPVPTYVIGFGIVAPEDVARLEKIAADTGGRYFPGLEDSSQLQSVMNEVGAALACQAPPRQFNDLLSQGQSAAHNVGVTAKTSAVQITLTWANPLDRFKLYGLKVVAGGQTVAVASSSSSASASRRRHHRKPRKLKVKQTTSATFTVLNISHLKKGRLRFRLRAAKVGSGAQATVTTQVSQIRRSHK
jgi:hypothetical protein